ncbi:hypothetical protein EON63_16585 [archaeon]|nr:MAG: hypothetical protein EON63_16585 [archaeon]
MTMPFAIKGVRRGVSGLEFAKASVSTATHTVFNQANPFVNVDVFQSDKVLHESISAFSKKFDLKVDTEVLDSFGKSAGSEMMMQHADLAEKNRPVLRQFDNYGRRIDVVDYHPSYHTLMDHGLSKGAAAYGFKNNTPGQYSQCYDLVWVWVWNENNIHPLLISQNNNLLHTLPPQDRS